jgi:preprotein translocase subunit SecE
VGRLNCRFGHHNFGSPLEAAGKLEMASKTNPFTFLQQVRQEVAKVTWPTRRETTVTTVMVLVMIVLAALFFLAVDQILNFFIGWLLSIGL